MFSETFRAFCAHLVAESVISCSRVMGALGGMCCWARETERLFTVHLLVSQRVTRVGCIKGKY